MDITGRLNYTSEAERQMQTWALQPCTERRCKLHQHYDIRYSRMVFQHGDNPEAVLLIDDLVTREWERPFVQFREWAERLHAYEDGALNLWDSPDDD